MCHSQLEPPKAGVGLQLRFAQGCFAVPALGGDEHLEAMTACTSRLQVSGFAGNRVCFLQFSSIEKDASEIALRDSRQRVEFYRLACLPLWLVESPEINNDSGQQIVGIG